MTPHGFIAAAIYDTSDGTTVQGELRGSDATPYTVTLPDGAPVDPYGNRYPGPLTHTLELLIHDPDWSRYAQLKEWYEAGTRVQAVCAASSAGGRNLQWYENTRISECLPVEITGQVQGESRFVRVLMTHTATGAAIYNNVNLLAYLGWSASGTIADGYTVGASGATGSFSDGVQTLTDSSGTATLAPTSLPPFPIEGVTLTLSTDFVALHAAGADAVSIDALGYDNTVLETASQAAAGTGRVGVSVLLPSGVYAVLPFVVEVTGISGAGNVQIKEPCLRVDGSTEYVSY